MSFQATENEHFLELIFHAPHSSNALDLEAARALGKIRRDYARLSKPVIVRSLHPRLFCSGGNLSDHQKFKSKAMGLKTHREITKHLDSFGSWPVIKLALVEGDVWGGGMEWLARFDLRWSTPFALFGFWQRRLGLTTGWGGGRAWARVLGEARIRKLILEGRLLSAFEAQRLGLVDVVRPPETLLSAAQAWAASLQGDPDQRISAWTVQNEKQTFQKVWLGPQHQLALKRWKPKR